MEGYVAPEDVRDLIAVADAAVAVEEGLDVLQRDVLTLADFKRATPNYGHQVLGLLLAEGALVALSWNWDTCIERSAPAGELLQVARTSEDMANLDHAELAKVHGCAAMPPTLLITSEQLANPPVWADQAFMERLRASTMVFVGIGDVADYARRRITELLAEVRPPDVRVVSKRIRDEWEQSIWAELMPELPEDRRVQQEADEFLDEVARAWTGELIQRLVAAQDRVRGDVRPGVQAAADAIAGLTSVQCIRWCRHAVMRPATGESAVLSPTTTSTLVAAGVLAATGRDEVGVPRRACLIIGQDIVEVLIADEGTAASEVQQEALLRAEQLANDNQLRDDQPLFLVGGTVMGLFHDSGDGTPDVVSGVEDPADVIDGPRALRPRYIRVTSVLEEAA